MPDGAYAYFAHSYFCDAADRSAVLALTDYGIAVGNRADLVILDTTTCLEAVTTIPPRLATFKAGQLVVRTQIERSWHPGMIQR